MRGKLIVIEGIDSSGKTTQLDLLKKHLKATEKRFRTIDFPRYDTSFYGKMIARFLRGEFGPLEHVDPHIISVIYALDRASAREMILQWLEVGEIVISNRYATSNMAHQAGRLPKSEREAFVEWDQQLEYKQNKIPKENIVLLMDVPPEVAQTLMLNENRAQAYREGEKRDMVEKDTSYLKHAAETYSWLADKFPHWVRVKCVDENGEMRSREDIHEEIKSILAKKKILR